MKKLFLAGIFTLSIFSVNARAQVYQVVKNTVLAATTEAITIQQPATGARQVTFISLYVDSTAAVTFTLTRNGTAATSTTLAVNNVNPGETAATTTAWSASNVGTGTTIASYGCNAACNLSIDLSGITFAQANGTGVNLTVKTSSITGTVNIVFKYSEKSL